MTSVRNLLAWILLPLGFILLTACGGGSNTSSTSSQSQLTPQAQTYISGAAIKGPLAFAQVGLFALDFRFEHLYDENAPLATTTTNAYAQITGLAVPPDVPPPYILLVDGTNAIDQNTNEAPVIKKLTTIITQDTLDFGQPIYATPYTTIAYEMLRLKAEFDGMSTDNTLDVQLEDFDTMISKALGFGAQDKVNIFTTSPILDSSTTDIEQQQLVVDYRATIEVLSSLLYVMSQSSNQQFTVDDLLKRLTIDLYADGIVDNAQNGHVVGGIDTALLSRDPMPIQIANTNYRAQDIVSLIDNERALIGSGSNRIFFHKTSMAVDLKPALPKSIGDTPHEVIPDPDNDTANTVDASVPDNTSEADPVAGEKIDPVLEGLNPLPNEAQLLIILKFDDLKQVNGLVGSGWLRLVDYLEDRNIKGSFGVICKTLENATPEYLQWIKTHHDRGLIEFWFHGWDHVTYEKDGLPYNEFVRPYDEQAERLANSQQLAKQKLGFPFETFGPPGGAGKHSFNSATLRLMSENPDIHVMLYPKPMNQSGINAEAASDGKFRILDRVWGVNLESSVGVPDFELFRKGFEANPKRKYFVLQGHPAKWDASDFAEFERIIDFLVAHNADFVTPIEAAAVLQ